nr:RNA-directed DNA polymerase, eukaryota [Tanacetum cinerariifolium]
MNSQVTQSFRREPRGGIELQQLTDLATLLDSVILNNSKDRWYCDLSGDGEFRVKELRNFIDDKYLPSHTEATRWVKLVPIKVNIFIWRARRDCLPTRTNLEHRGVGLLSSNSPICHDFDEDINHSLFRCDLAQCVLRRVCRWWNFDPQEWSTFLEWQTWFLSLRLASKNKVLLEGVFYVAWWSIWRFRNHYVFEDRPPRRSTIFDDIIFYSFNWCHSRFHVCVPMNPHVCDEFDPTNFQGNVFSEQTIHGPTLPIFIIEVLVYNTRVTKTKCAGANNRGCKGTCNGEAEWSVNRNLKGALRDKMWRWDNKDMEYREGMSYWERERLGTNGIFPLKSLGSGIQSSGNLKMSGNEDHHRQGCRFATGGNGHDGRDPRDVEIERLRQRVRELKVNGLIQMARRVFDYRIRRIADRGNKEDGPDSRARGDRFHHDRRSADRGNEKVDRITENISEIKGLRSFEPIYPDIFSEDEPMFDEEEVVNADYEEASVFDDDPYKAETKNIFGSIFTFDDIERNEGEKGLVEGDGPTVVTGGPLASMATLPFVPKVQVGLLVEARFTNLNLEGDLIKSPITVGSPINFKWQNKDNLVVAKNAQRKYYEGPTTTSLYMLNSLSSKIATTKCVGAELFERFKLIAKSDRSNAPYDSGGTGLIPGETTREVKLFRWVMVTLINGSRVDVLFDPGDFAQKAKLEDEFF